MYFPQVLRPRPILFDLGDTLLNHIATNPLPYFKEGVRLAYDFIVEQSHALPAYNKFHAAVRRSYSWAFLSATLRRREVDLQTSLIRLFQRLGLPSDHDFVMAVGEQLYRPMKQLGTLEEGVHAVLDRLIAQGHPLGIVSNTMVSAPILDQHLQEVDLLKYFPVRIYSSDVVGVVRGFRTDNKQWLLDQIYEMTDKRFAVVKLLLTSRPWDLFWMVEMSAAKIPARWASTDFAIARTTATTA